MIFRPSVFDKLERVVFAQRMSFPIRRQQNPSQVRMIAKHDAEQIVNFAFPPISRRPDAGDAIDALTVRRHLQTHAFVRRDGIQIVNDFEWRLTSVRSFFTNGCADASDGLGPSSFFFTGAFGAPGAVAPAFSAASLAAATRAFASSTIASFSESADG